MTTTALLHTITAAGVKLQLKDGQLRFRSTNGGPVPPELREQITTHRGVLVEALTPPNDDRPRDQASPIGADAGCFAPLDDVIIASEAERYSLEKIEACVARLTDQTRRPEATPLKHQALRDWTAIRDAKRRMTARTDQE